LASASSAPASASSHAALVFLRQRGNVGAVTLLDLLRRLAGDIRYARADAFVRPRVVHVEVADSLDAKGFVQALFNRLPVVMPKDVQIGGGREFRQLRADRRALGFLHGFHLFLRRLRSLYGLLRQQLHGVVADCSA
jgi:hypothetical protein